MTAREGQAPPPDHEDKPETGNGPAKVGERLTGEQDPKDPDGLLTVDGTEGNTDPDFTAGAGS
jgi:hypothetical protein